MVGALKKVKGLSSKPIPLRSADFSSMRTQAEAPSDNCEALPAVIVAKGSASNLTGDKLEMSESFVPGLLH